MEIKYTYRDEDIPIRKAEFKSSTGTRMEMGFTPIDPQIIYLEGDISKLSREIGGAFLVNFNRRDFADFTALVNRINKQINGG